MVASVSCIPAFRNLWNQKIGGVPLGVCWKEMIVGLAPSVVVVELLKGTLLIAFAHIHHQSKLVFRGCLYWWCLVALLHKKAHDGDCRREIWPSGVHRTFVIFSAKVRKNNDSQNKKTMERMHPYVSQWLMIGIVLDPSYGEWPFPFPLSAKPPDVPPAVFPIKFSPIFSSLCSLDSGSTRLRLYFDPASTF